LGDEEIAAECQARFRRFVSDPEVARARPARPVLTVIGRTADEKTWTLLHEAG
jgi:hypothetical protein